MDGGLWTWSSRCPLAVGSYGTCWGQRALWLQGYGAQVVLEGHWCPVAHDWRKGPSRVPCGTDEGTRGAIPIPWCPVVQTRALDGPSQSHGAPWHRGGAIPIPWCRSVEKLYLPPRAGAGLAFLLPAPCCQPRTVQTFLAPCVVFNNNPTMLFNITVQTLLVP